MEVEARLGLMWAIEPGLRFEVCDTGAGIEADKQALLFSPFSQVDDSPSRRHGGTGLGLAISKQLVELMGGAMGLESAPGVGSTFWFEVPLPTCASPEAPSRALEGRRVLLMEPHAPTREALSKLLAGCGARVQSSLPLEVEVFDLVLVSDAVPASDRGRLADGLTRQVKPARVLRLCSTTSAVSPTPTPGRLGFDGLLVKPVSRGRLRRALGAEAPGTRDPTPVDAPQEVPRLLVAEDNLVNQVVTRRLLERLGLQAEVVDNGEAALAALRARPYVAVLMDCHMPRTDGFEATRRIRQGDAGAGAQAIPIVALTADALPEVRQRCLDAGMTDYVSKPVRMQDLRAALARCLPEVEASPAPTPTPASGAGP